MIVSNEPGYYEDHSFGIRIEVSFIYIYIFYTCSLSGLCYMVLHIGKDNAALHGLYLHQKEANTDDKFYY